MDAAVNTRDVNPTAKRKLSTRDPAPKDEERGARKKGRRRNIYKITEFISYAAQKASHDSHWQRWWLGCPKDTDILGVQEDIHP